MATRFWVGSGSANTWAATGNTNWSASSGGANNASVPGVGDIAVFDSHSGSGNSVIGANITVQGLECDGSTLGTGAYAGTITHNGSVTLTINTGAANSLRFTSGMTYTPASTSALVAFTHTSGTANLKSAGKAFGGLQINGTGGTTTLVDDLKVNAVQNSTLTVSLGTLDALTNVAAITAIEVSLASSANRIISLGGTVKIGGNASGGQTIWNMGASGTFTKNSANIEILAGSVANAELLVSQGAVTYNDLIIDASTNGQTITFAASNCTFAHLTVGSGNGLKFGLATYTVSNAFTWTGTPSAPILLSTSSGANSATISVASGACSLTWGSINGVYASGGATFTGTNVLILGANGWSINPPADATTVAPTAAQVATAVWTDVTAGDFTVSASVGKSVMNGVALGTGLTINGYTGDTPQTGDAYARIGTAGVGLTNLGDTRIAHLDADISSRLATSSYTSPPSANTNADALLDRTDAIETGLTPRGLMRLVGATTAGKIADASTTTNTFRNAVADSKARVTATVDTSGNRTAITYDVT